MTNRFARAGLLVTLFAIVLAGCGWFGPDDVVLTEGSLVVDIADVPDGITKVMVTVTGEGMDPVSGEFTSEPTPSDPLIIPEGTGRRWTVVVDVANATTVTQYTAAGTADIVGGEITEVTASLSVSRRAVIVVDSENGRFVQLESADDDTPVANLQFNNPRDAEIGPDGKIYIVGSGEHAFVQSFDSIADTTPTDVDDDVATVHALAIDHVNRIVYYATDTTVYSKPLDGGTRVTHTPQLEISTEPEGQGIRGLAADRSGHLYIAYFVYNSATETTDQLVSKFLPDAVGGNGTLVQTHTVTTGVEDNYYWDVLWQNGSVFVADNFAQRIIELTESLDPVGTPFGTSPDGDPQQGEFLGPARFVGHGNPGLAVIDDDYWGDYDRVVGFDDLTGSGWVTSIPAGDDAPYVFFSDIGLPPQPPPAL